MTITLVDVGTTANDGTGDPLRTAFQTVNTALTRLDNTVDVQTGYVLLKDDGGSAGVAVTTVGNVGVGTTNPTEPVTVIGAISVQDGVNPRWVLESLVSGNIHVSASGSGVREFELVTGGGAYFMGGNVGIDTNSPTEAIDVNSDAIRVRSSQTPASASATGNAGTICWDANYIYVCTATNTWKRAALATW